MVRLLISIALLIGVPLCTPFARAEEPYGVALEGYAYPFPASYFEPLIRALAGAGYRVVAPDQIEFGKSSKFDDVLISFDMMATHMDALLTYPGLAQVDVIAHSMGNIAAVRTDVSGACRQARDVWSGRARRLSLLGSARAARTTAEA